MRQWILTALVGLMVCGSAGMAQAAGPAGDRFDRMDTNKDGKVTWPEFETGMPQMRQSAFEAIDTDKSGAIERAEWDKFRKDHGQSGQSGMGGMGAAPAAPGQAAPAPSGSLPVIQPPKK